MDELQAFIAMLAGSRPDGRLLEVRYRNPDGPGMRQLFIPATRVQDAAAAVTRFAARSDTYTGVLLRDRATGGRDAVSRSHLLFVEIDAPDAHRRLPLAPAPPSAVITSGSPGHLHAYFLLDGDIGVDELETGNRKLAHLIGGDLVSVDAARILRPPNSWSYKYNPPVRTRLEVFDPSRRYSYRELTAHLQDPAPKPTVVSRPRPSAVVTLTRPGSIDAHLRAIRTEDYVLALTGQVPNGERKINCPFPEHDDATASLQLRDRGEWNCFGCGTGGTIYDFAGHLFGIGTKGREFNRLRDRLTAELRISGPGEGMRRPQGRQLTPADAGTARTPAATAAAMEQ